MERKHNPTTSASHRSQFETPHLAPPSRITTAPTSEKSGHHFHHHPHRYRHHRDKSQPQSAIQLHPSGGLFADNVLNKALSRSNGATPAPSAAGSRRESLAVGKEELKEGPSQADVDKANEQRRIRNEELRTALQSLSSLSETTTRRLDTTYYNLLQTLATLVSTNSSLQELYHSAVRVNREFRDEMDELKQDIGRQLEGLHDFDGQQSRIEALQGRMQRKRNKLTDLEKRLGAVRDRVADWERREGEWQAKTTRRLRILWGAIAVSVLLVAVLLVLQHWPARRGEHFGPFIPYDTVRIERINGLDDIPVRRDLNVTSLLETSATASGSGHEKVMRQEQGQQPDTDPRLRVFDEL